MPRIKGAAGREKNDTKNLDLIHCLLIFLQTEELQLH